tara:strand:+ start:359 stop:673 length:315 start_codon:yes stop_codon:yes gene_type:complete
MAEKEIEFCEAIRIFAPNEKAQSFILATIKIDIAEMVKWLAKKAESGDESVRLDVKVKDPTRSFNFPQWGAAKPFATVNSWKPKPSGDHGASGSTPGAASDLPF